MLFYHFFPLKLQTRCHVLATPPPAGLQQINSNKEAHNPRDSPPMATGASALRRPSSSCPFSSGFAWLWFFTLWKACFLSRPLFSINTRNRSEASHNRYSSFPGTVFKIKLWLCGYSGSRNSAYSAQRFAHFTFRTCTLSHPRTCSDFVL